MNGVFDRVLGQLEAALLSMEKENDPGRRFAGCLKLVKESVGELKRELHAGAFGSAAEEIIYFRDQAPVIYSRLFYFTKLCAMETDRAYVTTEKFRVKLEQELERIEEFHERHREFVQYAQAADGFWDGNLYTRQGYGNWWTREEVLYIDRDFTIGSYWVAKSLANAELKRWLTGQLAALDDPRENEGNVKAGKIKLTWTANPTDLVEVLYALHLKGCLNNGGATLKDTMEGGAALLGVDLKRYHNTIQEIMRRKVSLAKFLTSLIKELEEKRDGML